MTLSNLFFGALLLWVATGDWSFLKREPYSLRFAAPLISPLAWVCIVVWIIEQLSLLL